MVIIVSSLLYLSAHSLVQWELLIEEPLSQSPLPPSLLLISSLSPVFSDFLAVPIYIAVAVVVAVAVAVGWGWGWFLWLSFFLSLLSSPL